ncbi:MAG: hypothetical protein BRC26_04075 [Nanohaloarchaea archaeon QH_8_44_6]|nr:MAG: hypothetical protein BRC26_04075 [Nanohaloarchaea archaeon QH_8_44_6]
MIREYGPIPLIPAAWTLMFLTVVYPGVDPYWIKHMHLFMLVFLGFFAVASGHQMTDKVMKAWRNIIAVGFFFTALGTAGFYLTQYQEILSLTVILYWFIAPAYGFKITSESIERYSELYSNLRYFSFLAVLAFAAGESLKIRVLTGAGLITAAAVQLISIILASKLDHE